MDDFAPTEDMTAPLRPPAQVMRLARLGANFPSRISFLRTLIRRLHTENAIIQRPIWDIDANGFGRAVYTVRLNGRAYSLVAFSQDIPQDQRSDRVIAEQWDTGFALFDGIPEIADLDRLQANVPLQEAGRCTPRELVLSRANKSVRLFNHVIDALSRGKQPDPKKINDTGYLMRTTAVYGNGKFGIADRVKIADRPELSGPFQAEMLTVWLIRGFSHDLVEHIALARAPDQAVPLAPDLKRHLGIGNATGLGMAPFLVHHPILLHNWIAARETALSRIRAHSKVGSEEFERFQQELARAVDHADSWQVDDILQQDRITQLRSDLAKLTVLVDSTSRHAPYFWEGLVHAAGSYGIEAQECLVALILEPHGAEIDYLADQMASDIEPRLEPQMSVRALMRRVRQDYSWALQVDFTDPAETAQFWYVSEEKQEPRLGDRQSEPGAELEMPLDIARQVQDLAQVLSETPATLNVAEFLLGRPDLRHIVRRVQTVARYPYGEIRDNLISDRCRPIDLLRCKLGFFGATKFDPKSDRWTRVTLFQGAPLRDEIIDCDPDAWGFATMPQQSA
jgi:hypothetical protein